MAWQNDKGILMAGNHCELQGLLPLFLSNVSRMCTQFSGMDFCHFRCYDKRGVYCEQFSTYIPDFNVKIS